MTPSLLRTLVLPPRYSETLGLRHWRMIARLHLGFLGVAVVLDIVIWFVLKDHPNLSRPALRNFMLINLPTMGVGGILWAALLLTPRAPRTLFAMLGAVIVAGTVLVWVQLTGSVTSYFMLTSFLVIFIYRLYIGYWVSLVFLLASALGHAALVVMEHLGWLTPESLFLSGTSPVYGVPAYRWLALASISWIYVLAFLAGNLVVNKLRAKDEAIAEIRAEAARVAEDVQHGRLTGTVLDDQYALGELLGRGGVGEVYAAERLHQEQRVAVKVLHAHLLINDTALQRFHREAELTRRLPAAHTAPILEVGHDPHLDLHYLVMEYLQGEDLGAYLRRRGLLALEELSPILRSVATILDQAHTLGVVHRDLKPQNIFLARAPKGTQAPPDVRLLDFGLGKATQDEQSTLTQDGAVLGTIAYMAPEQALGRPEAVGAAADRFALAGVAYRALTGRPPFQAGELISAIREILHVDPPPVSSFRPELHPHVDAVLALGLAKDPELRPATGAQLVDLLERAAQGRLDTETLERAGRLRSSAGEAATVMDGSA